MEREEIIKHLHEALNSVDITFPYRYVLVEAIEALSQPSLPDGLEEAADKQAFIESPYSWESQPGTFGSTPLFLMSNIRSAFKAGAEWMAGQGINAESGICKLADRAWVTPINEKQFARDVYDNFVAGDKVIVQIRKK